MFPNTTPSVRTAAMLTVAALAIMFVMEVQSQCCAPPLDTPLPDPAGPASGVQVSTEPFGEVDGQPVYRYTLKSTNITVQVINFGAHTQSISVPDRNGRVQDIVLGYDNLQGYIKDGSVGFPIMGRVANRIANSTFTLNGKVYKLNPSSVHYTIHGGDKGWGKMMWNSTVLADGVTFSLLSPDGDEHFPGAVRVQVTYRLTPEGGLLVAMRARCTQPTPIDMYDHGFINLGGHDAGPAAVNATRVTIYADRYLPLDSHNIPYGTVAPVKGTPEDLCTPRLMSDNLSKKSFDDVLVIARCNDTAGKMVKVVRAEHAASGRTLDLYSDQPQLAFYTADGFPDPHAVKSKKKKKSTPLIGKGGASYIKQGALSFVSLNFFDALHYKPTTPDTVLQPGASYVHTMLFRFGVQ